MRRTLAIGVTCAMTALGLITAGLGTAAAAPPSSYLIPSQDRLPAAIRLPAGFRVAKAERMRGVQIYTCTNGTWTFTEPRAEGRTLTHSKGPVWRSKRDGSLVGASKVAGAPGFRDSVEQLLLKASRNEGAGELSDVRFVQRLDTEGGTPEAARFPTCDGGLQGRTREAPYKATYTFAVQG